MVSVAEAAGRLGRRLLMTPIEGLPAAVGGGDRAGGGGALPGGGGHGGQGPRAARDRVLERGRRWLRTRREADVPEVLRRLLGLRPGRSGSITPSGPWRSWPPGGHHLLMVGSPGAGKTMLARRLAGILPPLTRDEAVDVTRVWSAAGLQAATDGSDRRSGRSGRRITPRRGRRWSAAASSCGRAR